LQRSILFSFRVFRAFRGLKRLFARTTGSSAVDFTVRFGIVPSMPRRASFLALLALLLLPPRSGADAQFSIVLRGGRIVDGTGNPWFQADLAIRDDRIVAIGQIPPAAGEREIDARGLIVAPGFIDSHSHSDWLLLEDGAAQSKIRQGVTTEVLGEGFSAGPWKGKLRAKSVRFGNREELISTLGDYFRLLERGGISVNVVSYAGIGNIWQSILGQSFEAPTSTDLREMKALLAEAMSDGAVGLSTQVMMPPGSLATTDQIVELCEVVRRFGGTYSSHIRNEGLGIFDSVKEAIEIGERARVPVDILHLKIADEKYWGRMNEVVSLIDEARRRGVNVQANIYPYTRGNNDLSSIIPPWAHEGGASQLLARLKNSADRVRIKREIREGVPGWYNHYTAVGGDWSRMLINGNNPYKGLTMDRVIALKNAGKNPADDPLDVLLDLVLECHGSVPTVFAHHSELDMNLGLSQVWSSIGSDGSAFATNGPLRQGQPHPRSFGTFPRVLGVYVRERKLLRLEDAVRKMTSLSAAKLALFDRGLLRPGMFADIAVFDPDRVVDRATYDEPFQYPEGIEYVIVNGRLVIQKGEHTGAKPGRVLRHNNESR